MMSNVQRKLVGGPLRGTEMPMRQGRQRRSPLEVNSKIIFDHEASPPACTPFCGQRCERAARRRRNDKDVVRSCSTQTRTLEGRTVDCHQHSDQQRGREEPRTRHVGRCSSPLTQGVRRAGPGEGCCAAISSIPNRASAPKPPRGDVSWSGAFAPDTLPSLSTSWATNAVKQAHCRRPGGRVAIAWSIKHSEEQPELQFPGSSVGGPPARSATHAGLRIAADGAGWESRTACKDEGFGVLLSRCILRSHRRHG